MPRYESSEGPAGGPANELELELNLKAVTLRDFDYQLRPLGPFAFGALRGLELEATAKDTGLKVSLRFDRSEFVNIATAGLSMLDAADAATDQTEGR